MQFIKDENDVLYPVSRIEAIKTEEDRNGAVDDVMIRVDGRWHRTFIGERQLTLMTSTVIVPAERHSAVLFHAGDASGPEFTDIVPIIAFALTSLGILEPIGLEGTDFLTREPIGILRPDGCVEIPGDECFDNVEEFKNAMRKRTEKSTVNAA